VVNVVVAAVFYVIGLLTDALVDTDALGDQLRQQGSVKVAVCTKCPSMPTTGI
jgi:hypothetical protein